MRRSSKYCRKLLVKQRLIICYTFGQGTFLGLIMRRLVAICAATFSLSALAHAAEPIGEWRVANGGANIRIDDCDGALWGVVCSSRVRVTPAALMESSVGRLQSLHTTSRLSQFIWS